MAAPIYRATYRATRTPHRNLGSTSTAKPSADKVRLPGSELRHDPVELPDNFAYPAYDYPAKIARPVGETLRRNRVVKHGYKLIRTRPSRNRQRRRRAR